MAHKKVENLDSGTTDIFGGNDLDKWSDWASGVDTDDYDINSDFTVRSGKRHLRNPANTFSYQEIASAITGNRTITEPLLVANDIRVYQAHIQALLNKTIDHDLNTIPNIHQFADFTVYRAGTTTKCRDNILGGTVSSSSTDPSIPIQYALTNGSAKRTYVAPGAYTLNAAGFTTLSFDNVDIWLDLSPGAILTVPNGFAGQLFTFTKNSRRCLFNGGQINEAGIQARNWDCFYFHGEDGGAGGQTGHIIQNVYARNFNRGIYMFTEGTDNVSFFINANFFNNFRFYNAKRAFIEMDSTISGPSMSRNHFSNMMCQSLAGVTQNGVVNVIDRANMFTSVVIYDFTGAGHTCSIGATAENTMIFGGIMGHVFEDLGADTFIVDPYIIKIPKSATQNSPGVIGELLIGGYDYYKSLATPSAKKHGGWMGTGSLGSTYGMFEAKLANLGAPPAQGIDADGSYSTFTTAATAGDIQGNRGNSNIVRRDYNPYFECKLKPLTTIAGVRISAGMINGTATPTVGGDPLASLNGILVHLNSGGTTWKIRHNNASATSTSIDTGVTAAADTAMTFKLQGDNAGGRWWYSVNDNAWGVFNTTQPGATTGLNPFMWIETVGAAARTMQAYYWHVNSEK